MVREGVRTTGLVGARGAAVTKAGGVLVEGDVWAAKVFKAAEKPIATRMEESEARRVNGDR